PGRVFHGQDGPVDGEWRDVVVRPAVDGQVAQNTADQRGELVAVGGAQRQRDLWEAGQRVDHEVAVGRQRIEAGFAVQGRAVRRGQDLLHEGAHARKGGRVGVAGARLQRDLAPGHVLRHLHARLFTVDGKAV